MQRKYIVLRDLADDFDGLAPQAGTRGPLASAAASHEPEVKLETVEVDTKSLRDIERQPDVIIAAPAMPMRLVEPRTREAAEPEAVTTATGTTWGVAAVGADRSPFKGHGVKIAVLDTGCDITHPAFKGVNFTFRNFTTETDEDRDGHGTHCAGTIFGREVDGKRIGVAPGVTDVIIGKVLGKGGGGSESIANAIQWSVEQGAQVISMSLGIDFPGFVESLVKRYDMPIDLATSRALDDYRANVMLFERLAELLAALKRAPLLVAAAGNESRCDVRDDYEIGVSPPAVADGFVSVAALGRSPKGLRVADFSNAGASVCAPGVDIQSAKPNGGLATMSGTSMAAPHVVGVAALWLERVRDVPNPSSSMRTRLFGSATLEGLDTSHRRRSIGEGMVQAPAAR